MRRSEDATTPNTSRHKYVAARPARTPILPQRKMGPNRFAYHRPTGRFSTLGRLFRWFVGLIVAFALLGLVTLLGSKYWIDAQTNDSIYEYEDPNLPARHVALVFGAGLNRRGEPSAMLYDRIATAVDLYKADKVDKLLMTGDNGTVTYNEVEPMRKTAVELGVPTEDIILDYAGFSTWDSCYRAREVFSLSEATLVTQRFHLPRAVYSCERLGVNAIGVQADRQPYPTSYNELRELPALANTFWNMLTNQPPRFLGPKVSVDEPQIP